MQTTPQQQRQISKKLRERSLISETKQEVMREATNQASVQSELLLPGNKKQ
jgi:predicted nuclease of restriction endonuclease-like (RecB) superfamily